MSNEHTTAGPSPSGTMLFYKQPELLRHQEHGSLGLRRPERPFGFATKARVLPLTLGEIPAAQKSYPVVFSDLENPVPLAVVGGTDDRNLFVDDAGNWERNTYIPAYVRCYPFALASQPTGEFAVVIDRAAEIVSDDPERPFFDGDQITPETQSLIDFCARYDAERSSTKLFAQKLKDLGLLAGQQVANKMADGTEITVASYVAVDSQKLNELDNDIVKELFDSGYLAGVFAHLFSLENWQRLSHRHEQAAGAA
jgi:hypothetical protein